MSDKITNENPGGLAGVIQQAITNYAKELHTCFPGYIVAFDSEKQIATVQPTIQRIFKQGDSNIEVSLPKLLDVPVWQPKAGGFSLTFPITPGDDCLVLIAERAMDAWLINGDICPPLANRMHSLSDAVALVGHSPLPRVLEQYSPDEVQLRNSENNVHITLAPNGTVSVKTGTTNIVLTKDGSIDVTAPTVNFTGDIVVQGDAIIGGISFVDHRHSGVESGSGNSGLPWSP